MQTDIKDGPHRLHCQAVVAEAMSETGAKALATTISEGETV